MERYLRKIVVLSCAMVGSIFMLTGCTEKFERSVKSTQSNFNGGLKREIIVYDSVGNEIFRQNGKFDIDYDGERILYDDEDNLRHQIYFKNGIVIVNELGD